MSAPSCTRIEVKCTLLVLSGMACEQLCVCPCGILAHAHTERERRRRDLRVNDERASDAYLMKSRQQRQRGLGSPAQQLAPDEALMISHRRLELFAPVHFLRRPAKVVIIAAKASNPFLPVRSWVLACNAALDKLCSCRGVASFTFACSSAAICCARVARSTETISTTTTTKMMMMSAPSQSRPLAHSLSESESGLYKRCKRVPYVRLTRREGEHCLALLGTSSDSAQEREIPRLSSKLVRTRLLSCVHVIHDDFFGRPPPPLLSSRRWHLG